MRYGLTDIIVILISLAFVVTGLLVFETPLRQPALWFFVACALLMLAMPWLQAKRASFQGFAEQVSFDADGVYRRLPDGRQETIRWRDLAQVEIITTDEGPYADDIYWLLLDADGSHGCGVSNYAEGFPELLKRLQELPGFDNEAVIRAMGSTDNARYKVWGTSQIPNTQK